MKYRVYLGEKQGRAVTLLVSETEDNITKPEYFVRNLEYKGEVEISGPGEIWLPKSLTDGD